MPLLAIVLLSGLAVVRSADPEYRAAGSVVLLRYDPAMDASSAVDGDTPRNPFTEFNAALTITAAVVEQIGNGQALQRDIVEAGGTANFTVEQEEDAPILHIEATANRAAQAIESVTLIADALTDELAARQEQLAIRPQDRVVIDVVLRPERASELQTSRTRALTIVIALGTAGVIAAALLTESVAQGRARRRRSRTRRRSDDPFAAMPLLPPASGFEEPNGEPRTPAERRRR